MFKKWFTKQENKNVWDILDYYVSASKYLEQCERLAAYSDNKDYIFPPITKLDSQQNKNLRYKSNLQWQINYLASLEIYYEFTSNGSNEIYNCKRIIKKMKDYPDMFQS